MLELLGSTWHFTPRQLREREAIEHETQWLI